MIVKIDTRSLRNTSRVLAMDVLVVFANFFSFPFFFFLSFIAKKLSKSAMLAELQYRFLFHVTSILRAPPPPHLYVHALRLRSKFKSIAL